MRLLCRLWDEIYGVACVLHAAYYAEKLSARPSEPVGTIESVEEDEKGIKVTWKPIERHNDST